MRRPSRTPTRSRGGRGRSWAGGLIWVLAQVVVAVLLVLAPEALLFGAAGAAVLALVMWGFGDEPLLRPSEREPGRSDGRAVPLPAVWSATIITLVLFVLDVQGVFTHNGTFVTPLRYLLLPVPFVVIALAPRRRPRRRRLRFADGLIGILLVWGLCASLSYKFLAGGAISGLSFFLPMILALLHVVRRGGPTSDEAATRMLDLLSYAGFAYVLVHLAAGLGVPGIARGAHGHQSAFLFAAAVAAAYATGRRKLATVEVWLIAGIYFLYPAATYVTTVGAVLVTVLLLSPSRTGLRKAVIGIAVPSVLFLGFSSSLSDSRDSLANTLLPKYFDAIGKSDNSGFRREMLRLGVEQVRASPVIGSNFRAGFALPTQFRAPGDVVLPHNDFLEIALAGGLLALALFVGWAIATNIYVVRRHRLLVAAGADARARLVWTLLIAYNACLSVALFQPVLFEVGTVTLFFLLFASMRHTCDGDDETEEAHAREGEGAARVADDTMPLADGRRPAS